jgi:hypothetical protein
MATTGRIGQLAHSKITPPIYVVLNTIKYELPQVPDSNRLY